jgi:hypothetical protein
MDVCVCGVLTMKDQVFSYGCRPVKGVELADKQPKGFERVFPKLMSTHCAAFKYSGCSYRLQKSKVPDLFNSDDKT